MRGLFIIFFLFFMVSICKGFAQPIRLAIFDNPRIDSSNPALSQKLQKSYMRGIKTAVESAKSDGFNIHYKTFFYGSSLLNIIRTVPIVERWKPDVIIGLHNSNQLLMTKDFFNDCLVLSIFATDVDLSSLPSNFYSLGVPDYMMARKMLKFIKENFPKKNIFIAVAADSKESFDMAEVLSREVRKDWPHTRVAISKFLESDISDLNMESLLKRYKKGDVIIVLSLTYYTQIELMNRVASYLSPFKPVFVTDVDNWGNKLSSTGANGRYTAYRITPLLLDKREKAYQRFVLNYKKLYRSAPQDSVEYATYQAVMSFVAAWKKFYGPECHKESMKKSLLCVYQKALESNPNWFRPKRMSIYKLEPSKEVHFETIS